MDFYNNFFVFLGYNYSILFFKIGGLLNIIIEIEFIKFFLVTSLQKSLTIQVRLTPRNNPRIIAMLIELDG